MRLVKLILKIVGAGIGACLLLYITLITALLLGPKFKSFLSQKDFNSGEWISHLSSGENVKQKMVNDLLSKHRLVGLSKKQIEELLGIPPKTSYFKDYDFVYWLGPERSAFGIDSEWLGIEFENGIVTKAEILRD